MFFNINMILIAFMLFVLFLFRDVAYTTYSKIGDELYRLKYRNVLDFTIPPHDLPSYTDLIDSDVVFLYSHNYSKLPEYYPHTMFLITEYCKKHGYTLLEINHVGENDISSYWLRVKDLVELSHRYDENTIFIYMDMDTCINPSFMNIRVCDIVDSLDPWREWHIYIGKDPDVRKYVNTGVMIIKNTQWSKELLKLWWSHYNPGVWSLSDENKWICQANGIPCEWADSNYEQGMLELMIRKNMLNSKSNIAVLQQSIISNHVDVNPNSFIYHRMGPAEKPHFFKALYDAYISQN